MLASTISEELDLGHNFTKNKMNQLLKLGKVHICDWIMVERENGIGPYPRPLYRLGPGKNKPKPKKKNPAIRQRESFRRAKEMMLPMHPGITQRQAVALRSKLRGLGLLTRKGSSL